jgi:amino acid transporter
LAILPLNVDVRAPRLKRSLTLWDLILYGVVVIQPTAPMSVFGVLSGRSGGHVVTTILLAMVAMTFTAVSYGRMAQAYPSAGSAFTYVGKEINPALGYVTGWGMVMDYMLNPIIMIIWCSKAAMNFAPGVPYSVWAVFFFFLFTALNLCAVKNSARINLALATVMSVVIAIFFVAAARYIFRNPHDAVGFFTRPFYDPASFKVGPVLSGTSIAVLTYIGFDGISTLSEEAENPRRNILLATVLTCVVIGILSAMEVYAAQLVWPSSRAFRDIDTAYVEVAARVAGSWFFLVMNLTLLLANFGSGVGAQLGAARLLYAMGRSNALPRSFFGVVDSKRQIPRNNVILVGAIALIGAFVLSYGLGAEMLNFGALVAFMGVNAAAFMRYYVRAEEKKAINFYPPLFGFVICLILWLSLSRPARIAGAIWMGAGVAFGAWKTSGFRHGLVDFDLPPEVL